MSKQQISESNQSKIRLYNYDRIIFRTFALMEKDLSKENVNIIKKFDMVLVNESLSDAKRSKILGILLSLSRILGKNWDEIIIPKKAVHRLEATTDLKILEISYGDCLMKQTSKGWKTIT